MGRAKLKDMRSDLTHKPKNSYKWPRLLDESMCVTRIRGLLDMLRLDFNHPYTAVRRSGLRDGMSNSSARYVRPDGGCAPAADWQR